MRLLSRKLNVIEIDKNTFKSPQRHQTAEQKPITRIKRKFIFQTKPLKIQELYSNLRLFSSLNIVKQNIPDVEDEAVGGSGFFITDKLPKLNISKSPQQRYEDQVKLIEDVPAPEVTHSYVSKTKFRMPKLNLSVSVVSPPKYIDTKTEKQKQQDMVRSNYFYHAQQIRRSISEQLGGMEKVAVQDLL